MWGPSEWGHNTSENSDHYSTRFFDRKSLLEDIFHLGLELVVLGLSFPIIYRRFLLSLFTDIMGTKYNADPRKKVTILPRFLTRMIETYKLQNVDKFLKNKFF